MASSVPAFSPPAQSPSADGRRILMTATLTCWFCGRRETAPVDQLDGWVRPTYGVWDPRHTRVQEFTVYACPPCDASGTPWGAYRPEMDPLAPLHSCTHPEPPRFDGQCLLCVEDYREYVADAAWRFSAERADYLAGADE